MSFITTPKVKYGGGAKLLFTNADSLVYETETDVYENFLEDKSLFDFSDYPRDLQFYHPVNKKVLGKMKDEVRENIHESVGLKLKM